ncbi:hypothetical protein B0I37DRAFT_420889 [Chaetomium sp. MPI-CAGE-AT-0009]|nr:hypothetical protein B0I37DRAFT_420889 [Chaetomium sp. MPI-CAGE-AT-0009]
MCAIHYLAGPLGALVVHVDVRFTDPVIRSRYYRSYGSSSGFQATNRICRGLVRRIERCSEEFITRKDSGALEMFNSDTYERKSQRFEMTFRIMRRGMGEWAERTYRSYQKQPLTVAHTKEVMLAVHWMIGLFLRRHDESFQWLNCPAPEVDLEGSETTIPSQDGPLSLLSIPRSRFIEASQVFEFVPGYSIEIYFQSRNPHRRVPTFERRTRVTSIQTTPLTLFLSEDMLWKALQFANQALDSKKQQFDHHLRDHRELGLTHLQDDTLELSLRVQNHLGPAYNHVQRSIKSKLALFRDPDAQDCATFLSNVERYLSHIRDETDAILSGTNDFEVRISELKGVGWTLREPAKFTLGPSASYGRRTIQAALDRIQTGVGDVIRGHNIAIHISAQKRGHLVLDKAIVAHEKHGNPKETFASREDAQVAFVERLKARVQTDMDKIFEDSCSIDGIPQDEDDYFAARPATPLQPQQVVFDESPPKPSPSSVKSSSPWSIKSSSPSSVMSSPAKPPALGVSQSSPKPRSRRFFSLSRRSTESVRSIDYLKKAARDLFLHDSKPGSAVSEQTSGPRGVESPVPEAHGLLLAAAEVKPTRSFSLFSRKRSFTIRVSNASTLVEEQNDKEPRSERLRSGESRSGGSMTSREEEASSGVGLTRTAPEKTPSAYGLGISPAVQQTEAPSTKNKNAPAAAHKKQLGRMDTPEFIDAREYVVSPASEEVAQSELSGALARVASPREDDEFSTAPSTPELSTGSSSPRHSPRHSVLITPAWQRTKSGTEDSAHQERPPLYPSSTSPEPKSNKPDSQAASESQVHTVPLGAEPNVATDSLPAAPASDSPTSESEVRGSGPSEEPPARAPEVLAPGQCEASPEPADRLDASLSEPEACVGEAAGSELGAGCAAVADPAVPVPAGPATEADTELCPTPDGPEVSAGQLGNGHAAGDLDQKSPLKGEEQAAVSDLGSDTLPNGNGIKEAPSAVSAEFDASESSKQGATGEAEECISVPVLGGLPIDNMNGGARDKSTDDATGTDSAGRGTLDGDGGESITDPNVTGAAEAELPKLGSGEDTEDESNPVPTVTLDKRNAGEQAAEQSVTAPACPEVVKPEAWNDAVGRVVGQELSQDVDSWSPGIGGKDAYESEPPRSDARIGNDNLRKTSFGPEAGIDEAGASSEVGDGRVCADRGTPAPDFHNKHVAPAIPVDSLTPHGSETSGSPTGAAQSRSPVDPSARKTRESAREPAPTQPAKAKATPRLAPIPDPSKLPKPIPVRTRTSLSSDAASFTGTIRDSVDTIRDSVDTIRNSVDPVRDSVDTIRPSTDEIQHPAPPLAEQAHTTSSGPPKTAGYLNIGLRESRLVEVGLRGALGGALASDVRARRRRSLPLAQHLLLPDGGGAVVGGGGGGPAAAAAARSLSSGPAGKAGDERKSLSRGEGEADGDGYDDGRSGLPSLMMLLAGAVAIGKILKGPGV